jgi:hypothetical protein
VDLPGRRGDRRAPAGARRLVEAKRRHDPDNLFRLNWNVHPASLPAAAPTR